MTTTTTIKRTAGRPRSNDLRELDDSQIAAIAKLSLDLARHPLVMKAFCGWYLQESAGEIYLKLEYRCRAFRPEKGSSLLSWCRNSLRSIYEAESQKEKRKEALHTKFAFEEQDRLASHNPQNQHNARIELKKMLKQVNKDPESTFNAFYDGKISEDDIKRLVQEIDFL